jgi:hypothetical protein
MAAEDAFLTNLATFLQAAGLTPAPARIGIAEPVAAGELPALVLSLETVQRRGGGLAEGATVVEGALAVSARIDLANPVLPEEPSFVLLSADRLTLVLPHGGWVKADGSSGPLAAADLQVTVAGAPRTVVNAAPGPAEVRPDATVGTLLFGAALPAAGLVEATYFLGQWERIVTPIAGTLRIDVRGADAGAVGTLGSAVLGVLVGRGTPMGGLRKIALGQLGSVAAPDTALANSRGRALHFAFEYDHEENTPASSGGVIRRVPITSRLEALTVDRASGAIQIDVIEESE